MSSKNILGQRVFELRKSAGMTQKQLGESVGLSMQAINDIEKGRRETTISKVILLAQIIKTTLDYLVGETDDPKRYVKPTKMESFFSDKSSVDLMKRLFALCKQKGVTIGELDAIIVAGEPNYTGMISYDFPSICALADYFDVSLDYLVGRTDKPEVNK